MGRLEHVSEFIYLGCILDESGTDEAKCHRKGVNGKRVAGTIRSLDNATDLQFECARIWHERRSHLFFMYGSEKKSRIRAVQVDNLRGLLGIRRMDRVPNTRIKELCGVTKGVRRKD